MDATDFRNSFDPPLQGPLQMAMVTSPETQAASICLDAWWFASETFETYEREELVSRCWASQMPPGCFRWNFRKRRARRRRRFLGLSDDQELPPGPPLRLKLCERCRKATYCSRMCQMLHWPTHKLRCCHAQ